MYGVLYCSRHTHTYAPLPIYLTHVVVTALPSGAAQTADGLEFCHGTGAAPCGDFSEADLSDPLFCHKFGAANTIRAACQASDQTVRTLFEPLATELERALQEAESRWQLRRPLFVALLFIPMSHTCCAFIRLFPLS